MAKKKRKKRIKLKKRRRTKLKRKKRIKLKKKRRIKSRKKKRKKKRIQRRKERKTKRTIMKKKKNNCLTITIICDKMSIINNRGQRIFDPSGCLLLPPFTCPFLQAPPSLL